jgi:hypothetical protein
VLLLISAAAAVDFPDDFSTRLYRINTEVEAWRVLQELSHPGIPVEIVNVITGRATRDFPNDYSTRLYRINQEIRAWLNLQYDDGLSDARMW